MAEDKEKNLEQPVETIPVTKGVREPSLRQLFEQELSNRVEHARQAIEKSTDLFQTWKRMEKKRIEAELLRELRNSPEEFNFEIVEEAFRQPIVKRAFYQSFNLGISTARGLVSQEALPEIAEKLKGNRLLLLLERLDPNQRDFPLWETSFYQLSKIEKELDAVFVSGFAYQVAKEVAEKNLVEPFKELMADRFYVIENSSIVENLIRDQAQRDNVKEEVLSLIFENKPIEKSARGIGVDL